jgi:uncharacterized protein (TIGR02757 family)
MAAYEWEELKSFLDSKVKQYNQPAFVDHDPILIPHAYTKKEDIEITAFWAATLAWGQRVTIIRKCQELFQMMDNAPYDFIMHHNEADLKPFLQFKHRTFNDLDTLYFISSLKRIYQELGSLEQAFAIGINKNDRHVGQGLAHFHDYFFAMEEAPHRTRKHVATPLRKSACKRLNMFLRWMVRKDHRGVDFGIWNQIEMHQLVCPCDLHVDRVARNLGLIRRKQTDWQMALELTESLKMLDPKDPVKYDFALFGLGIEEKY